MKTQNVMTIKYGDSPHNHPLDPTTRAGGFALRKTNPSVQGFATIEHISSICTIIDSIGINTEFVYEIYTPFQEIFYMRLVDIVDGKPSEWSRARWWEKKAVGKIYQGREN